MTSKALLHIVLLLTTIAAPEATIAQARTIPSAETYFYEAGQGITFSFTDGERFVNLFKNGKLIWRQYLDPFHERRIRPHEERRFYFEDLDKNGKDELYYVFENYIVTADMGRPESFWTKPVEKQERDQFFNPMGPADTGRYSLFWCRDLGVTCTFMQYDQKGRCYDDETGSRRDFCDNYAGNPLDLVSIATSPKLSRTDWDYFFQKFSKYLSLGSDIEKMRYALSKGHVSEIKVPIQFQPLLPWVSKVQASSPKVPLYRYASQQESLRGYLIQGDVADVLNRREGRYLVRYKHGNDTTIGWINFSDVTPLK